LSTVRLEEAEEEDFRFWYEGLTSKQRLEAVYEALEMSLKMKGVDAVPRLRRVHRMLNDQCVKYLIVGAQALAFHARPRATKDLDILTEPTPENAKQVLQALRECLRVDTVTRSKT
jgi:hypothetical protein